MHVVQDLLQGESILYSVFPVHGYDEIISHTEKGMQDDSEVRATHLVRSQFIIQEVLCCCVPSAVALHFHMMCTDIPPSLADLCSSLHKLRRQQRPE